MDKCLREQIVERVSDCLPNASNRTVLAERIADRIMPLIEREMIESVRSGMGLES